MPIMRAKMKVTEVHDYGSRMNLKMSAVCKSDGYPEDGTDEDNTFARWTPSADLIMNITNPDLFGKFSVGQTFYVDFTEVYVDFTEVEIASSDVTSVN